MGKSKRKPYYSIVCGGDNMKEWRTISNRKLRRKAKQVLHNCKDYDNLVVPILREVSDVWSSPRDGNMHYYHKPLMNQCVWDEIKYINRWGRSTIHQNSLYGFDGQHYKNCHCYTNKRGSYWKLKRK